MSEAVTKMKNRGQVAQGHKLVALNRERKKGLKAKQPVEQPTEQSAEQHAEHHAEQPSRALGHTTLYGGGAVAICVGLALYLHFRGKKPTLVAHPIKPNDDIFCMN